MKFQLLSVAAAAAVASAQGLSSGCTTQVGLLAFGDLGQCLQLTQILSVFSSTSGSVITPLNNYLNSLCASSTPRCSNATLTSANSTIQSACASDASGGGQAATIIQTVGSVLQSYPYFITAACSKNTTTNNFCLTDTLTAVQNATGQDVSFSTVSSLLSGGSAGIAGLSQSLSGGQLCTGCVSGFYQQAIAANATITTLPAASAIQSQCGSNFGRMVTGVSSSAPAASGTGASGAASSSAAASSSRAAGFMTANTAISFPAVAAALSIVGGIAVGGLAVM
ncbi:uncharacterized protein MKK02DRAFT_29798 [Dioszegia hungarica]|uniref:DUF7729 domain-containing protein n=1 Tax=Dioszegia hungarica TaxID=4972 RepID=A0AA38HEP3_9TREE|nr:uncharacterized protein MKK02DRAFT_29798 [Dioszegia hungarica]KAI9639827.1 hypothetical protein MKK02DRAFT_29798 [Dioszegia hungarica]